MKTVQTKLYSFKELSDEAKKRVIAKEAEKADVDGSDLLASVKAVCEACNLSIRDYQWGAYCQGWKLKVEGYNDGLQGNKALAWFARILMTKGYSRPTKGWKMEFPGICGFTGVCYDEDVIESVWESLLEGETVRMAFDGVAGKACDILETELDYAQSEECILQYLDENAEIYTEEGREF